jgi:N-acetylmuramoyl-L-alanine amidase
MHRRRLLTFLLAGVTLPAPFLAQAAQTVLAARGWRHDGKMRLVLDLSGEVRYETFDLAAPPRMIIDLHGTRLAKALNDASLVGAPLKAIRSSDRGNGDTRLVLEFVEPVDSSSFVLPPSGEAGHRLVLDFKPKAAPATVAAVTEPAAPAVVAQTVQPEAINRRSGQRDIIVVVDAGHGGKDPGALGAKGEQEKHVALSIAQMLAARINRQKGYKARLVRNDDIFIPLRKRVDVARKYNADMFVSVHADAAPRRTASGASVFALSEHGATSTMARWMADQENSADLIGSQQLLNLKDKDPMVANVILDMSLNSTISASLDLGGIVLDSVGKVAGVHGERVEQAGFAVLKSPDIPSILVETGFISNARDCQRLMDMRHRQNVATAIFDGVSGYFGRNPPAGTYLAEAKGRSLA